MQTDEKSYEYHRVTVHREDQMAARQAHKGGRALHAAYSRVREGYGIFLSHLLSQKFAEQLGGEFRVSVHGKFDGSFDSLARLHWDARVFFCPSCEGYLGLMDPVEPIPGLIDIQEAELNRKYVELAAAKNWKLTHAAIVSVLEFLEENGLGKIDALMCEVENSLDGDEPGAATLLTICSVVTEKISML